MFANKNKAFLQTYLLLILLVLGFGLGATASAHQAYNLALSVKLPPELMITAGEVEWRIRSQETGIEQRYVGYAPLLALPAGQYAVNLAIGTYTTQQTITVLAEHTSSVPFSAQVGRVRVNSSLNADWKIIAQNGESAGKMVSQSSDTRELNVLLASGEYEVVATRGNGIQHSQRLQVNAGKLSDANIQIPSGKVTLVATLDNGPALRPMSWTVYRLDGGKQTVATPRRHSANLEVAPGHYEAVAKLEGQERRRAFTVLTDTSNLIVIAMD
ncbi:MAG: hypothetical protein QJT81_00495 [Candidatus Thiothrix putei]|uniref:Uncharacterized protein n=1 Tax=Candidatus Thiothrix putei TaxID=3080811 RepID=A0AA95HBU4_9GAMM|nr:MAG: hypothetical protein QJT81_00495 [Candidatus Thiothrix putei]